MALAHAEKSHGDPNNWRARYKRPDGTLGSKSGFSSKTAAEDWGDEQEALIRRNMWIDPRDAGTLLSDIAEEWLAAITPRLALGTAAKYRSHLDTHIIPQWQAWPVIGIFNGYIEIEKWVSELHEDYAETTVASVFATFSTLMNVIVRARMIPANPCYGVRVTAGDFETERLVASPVQGLRAAMRLYESGLGLNGFVLCLMDLYTGGRWGELVGQQAHELPVPVPTRRRGRQKRGRTKTPAGTRTVQLPPGIAELYELLLDNHSNVFVFTTWTVSRGGGRTSGSATGALPGTASMRKIHPHPSMRRRFCRGSRSTRDDTPIRRG